MSGSDHKTVNIKGLANKHEYFAAVALTVGMVVQRNANGKLALSAVASATSPGGEYIVAEAPERGKGIYSTGTTESTYLAEEYTPVISPARGDEVLVLLTSAQAITDGGLLEVAATGKVIAGAGVNLAAFRAKETLTATGQDVLIWATRL